ncbi:DUF6678 family protein [Aquimarina sp. 2201CG14-23]|uniref:DUF6678 family protein n=1 Tax=Aquimarina mycalae TaxID=3040073 RepID=UPI002477D7A4|nr:DUF6678 family protein [Aquimarina sp. 2201CG14-23]MDH7447591.1 hypothetical protein [Aquimarina sp. 2201CG14-23]
MSRADKYQLKLQQEIDSRASFMNDAKWKALFSLLKDVNPSLVAKVKLLLDERMRAFTIPNVNDLIDGKYIEKYWGVFELKEIEWIVIPSEIISERKNREEQLVPKVRFQNIVVIEEKLKTGKKFEYERSELGLKVYGYR